MFQNSFSSKLLESAVNEFSKLPGIGKKTALRLVLHLLKQSEPEVTQFGETLIHLRQNVLYCKICHNISDTEICEICATPSRNGKLVCVVENIKDVLTIEFTQQYNGLYHVLGGVISPMDGISPTDLTIESLIQRAKSGQVTEVIFALPTTMEGDTTNFYIYKKLNGLPIEITTLARGVSIGNDLEYTDEVTLGRSIVNRVKFAL